MKKIVFFLVALMWVLPIFADMTSDGVKDLEAKLTFSKDKLGIIHNVSIKNIGKESYVIFYVLFEYYGSDGKQKGFVTKKQLDGLIRPNEIRTFENISSGIIPSYILSDISNSKVIITSAVAEEQNKAAQKDVDKIIDSLKRHGEFERFKKDVSEMLDN